MWYFAYGSNLSTAQMTARTGWPGTERPLRVRLPGYRLAFYASGSGQAYANIVRPGDGVLGVLYQLDARATALLDGYEEGYERVRVEVLGDDGTRIEAAAYVARPGRTTTTDRPTAAYLGRILAGAREHGLPEEYIRSIEAAADAQGRGEDAR